MSSISRPGPRSQRSPERADDARRDGGREPERVADRNHELPHLNRLRIAEPQRGESRRRCSDNGEVGVRILADELGRQLPPVGERHVNRFCLVNDVAVGENQAVRRDDKARALAARARGDRSPRPSSIVTTDGPTCSTARTTACEYASRSSVSRVSTSYWTRNSLLRIFPVALVGNSVRNSMRRGYL